MSRGEVNSRTAQQGPPFEMLEPYDGKLWSKWMEARDEYFTD